MFLFAFGVSHKKLLHQHEEETPGRNRSAVAQEEEALGMMDEAQKDAQKLARLDSTEVATACGIGLIRLIQCEDGRDDVHNLDDFQQHLFEACAAMDRGNFLAGWSKDDSELATAFGFSYALRLRSRCLETLFMDLRN